MEIYCKNEALLERAKEIFGDIVVAAYFGEEVFEWSYEKSVFDFIERVKKYKSSKQNPGLDFEYFNVVLKFSNGKLVQFWASEWGGAKQIKEEDLKIV